MLHGMSGLIEAVIGKMGVSIQDLRSFRALRICLRYSSCSGLFGWSVHSEL